MSNQDAAGYAGDVAPQVCLLALKDESNAQLIDVRTSAEWAYVGLPDLRAQSKELIKLEWQVFPTMTPDPAFMSKLDAALGALGVDRDAPLYFLCRSGVRSKAAAIAATAAGYARCYNVSGGFEGPPDPDGHRGRVAGWKAEGLPWLQT